MEKSIKVFLSYAHKDKKLLEGFINQLKLLERQELIGIWYDCDIGPGTEWQQAIITHLNTAHLILLLISAAFIASDFCYTQEMFLALKRHEAGEARIIPVILRPVDWQTTPFGKLQALPSNGKPVASWRDKEEAFLNIVKEIRKAIKDLSPLPPINSNLLTILNFQKELCEQNNIPFFTPSLLMMLLEISGGIAERSLENVRVGFATELRRRLKAYITTVLRANSSLSFSDFRWEERADVQRAQQLALQEHEETVTEKHLLLGILETKSNTQQTLKDFLGESDFRKLIQTVQNSPAEAHGTPGIRSFFSEVEHG